MFLQILCGIFILKNLLILSNCAPSSTTLFMTPERAVFTNQNPEFVKDLTMNIRRVSRTSFALSTNLNFIKDIEDAEIQVDFKQFLNNEYKPSGITIVASLCDLISDEDLNVYKKDMTDGVHGNIPDCEGTFPKGNYFMKDAIVQSEIKKSVFLSGKWRSDFKVTNKDDKPMFAGQFFFRVEEKLTD